MHILLSQSKKGVEKECKTTKTAVKRLPKATLKTRTNAKTEAKIKATVKIKFKTFINKPKTVKTGNPKRKASFDRRPLFYGGTSLTYGGNVVFEIDRIPTPVLQRVQEKGIEPESLLLGVYCDRTALQEPAEIYLLATKEKLLILSGVIALEQGEKKSSQRPRRVWKESEWSAYELSELHAYRVEEMLSSGAFTAKSKSDDSPVLLASFTNFCKDSVFLFVKYLKKIAKGEFEGVDPKDDPNAHRCPKCGMRYPDKNRSVCPRCMEKGKLFKRFSVFLLRYKRNLIILLFSLVVLTATSILAPYLSSGFFYDEVIYGTGRFAGELLLVLGIVIATRVLKTLAQTLNSYLSSLIAVKMVFDLKRTIFSSIKRLSLSFFTGRQTGGLMTQVNQDAETINWFFCDGVPYLIVNVVQVAVLTVLLFLIQPVLAAISLVTVPLFMILLKYMFGKSRRLHAKRYSASRQMNSFLSDVLSGMRVVKAFSREKTEIGRFTDRNGRLADSDKRLGVFNSYAWPLAGMVLTLGNVIAWGVGGWMVMNDYGSLTYGMLLTFTVYLGMVFSPLNFFIDFIDWTADCTNAMSRLFEIMDAQPDVCEREDALNPETLGGAVEFDHVSFSYEKGKKIIKDVSFSVEDGKFLGIVGHTGAGKSTLANLLMRLYEVEEGEIRIGGYPVKNLKLSAIYDHVAIVSQETYLFMGTILDNIRYANPNATFEQIVEASRSAGAHEFIMKLPDAYHTRIGFGYQDLSGGERQRISIARAILKNPKILILDEATAAMDTGTERKIQEALTRLINGKTTIMIAHRLSTLRDANRLIVIENGKVAEEGTHKELLAREDGVYKKLFTLQIEALKNAGIAE